MRNILRNKMRNINNQRKKGRDNLNRLRPDIFLKARGIPHESDIVYVPLVLKSHKPYLPVHVAGLWQ